MNLETELQSKRLPSLCRLPATPLPPDTRPCGRSLAAPQARKASQSRRRHNRKILRRLLSCFATLLVCNSLLLRPFSLLLRPRSSF